jgi:hypothetical protein
MCYAGGSTTHSSDAQEGHRLGRATRTELASNGASGQAGPTFSIFTMNGVRTVSRHAVIGGHPPAVSGPARTTTAPRGPRQPGAALALGDSRSTRLSM